MVFDRDVCGRRVEMNQGDSCTSTLSQGNESSSKSGLNGRSRRHFLASEGVIVGTQQHPREEDRISPIEVNRDLARTVTSQRSRGLLRRFQRARRFFLVGLSPGGIPDHSRGGT